MIPGNRPEDLEEEAFFDALESALDAKLGPEKFKRWVVLFDNAEDEELIVEAVRIASELGYERGVADARMEADIIEGVAGGDQRRDGGDTAPR